MPISAIVPRNFLGNFPASPPYKNFWTMSAWACERIRQDNPHGQASGRSTQVPPFPWMFRKCSCYCECIWLWQSLFALFICERQPLCVRHLFWPAIKITMPQEGHDPSLASHRQTFLCVLAGAQNWGGNFSGGWIHVCHSLWCSGRFI